MLLGLAIFVAVYALLAVPRVGRAMREAATARWGAWGARLLSRPGIALVGAFLAVALLQVTPREALLAIDWRTLLLLAGMMLLVAALDAANAFSVLASHLAARLRTPLRLLAGSMVVVAILSALVLNDAVVLLFTPVLVRAARAMGVTPIPFLVGEAIAANLGSVATPTGNPQNAAIANAFGLTFVEFSAPLLPLAILGLAVGVVACVLFFRRDLLDEGWRMKEEGEGSKEGRRKDPFSPLRPSSIVLPLHPLSVIHHPAITNRSMLVLALASVGLALVGFFFLPVWIPAIAAGALVVGLAPAARVSPRAIARRIDLGILGFFVGLFVLLVTVRASGFADALAVALDRGGSGGFVVATTVLSNVVSNVPAVLLLLPTIQGAGQALLLAAASTYAGNATFLGSAATVIVAETARREGADFSVLQFTLVGLRIAMLTLALAWWMLG